MKTEKSRQRYIRKLARKIQRDVNTELFQTIIDLFEGSNQQQGIHREIAAKLNLNNRVVYGCIKLHKKIKRSQSKISNN